MTALRGRAGPRVDEGPAVSGLQRPGNRSSMLALGKPDDGVAGAALDPTGLREPGPLTNALPRAVSPGQASPSALSTLRGLAMSVNLAGANSGS